MKERPPKSKRKGEGPQDGVRSNTTSANKTDTMLLSKLLYNATHAGARSYLRDPRILQDNFQVLVLPKWNTGAYRYLKGQFELYQQFAANLVVEDGGSPPHFNQTFIERLKDDPNLLGITVIVRDNGPNLWTQTGSDGLCAYRRVLQHISSNGKLDTKGRHDPNLNDPEQRQQFVNWLNLICEQAVGSNVSDSVKRAAKIAEWIIKKIVEQKQVSPQANRELWGNTFDIMRNIAEIGPAFTTWQDYSSSSDSMGVPFRAATGIFSADKKFPDHIQNWLNDIRKEIIKGARFRMLEGHVMMKNDKSNVSHNDDSNNEDHRSKTIIDGSVLTFNAIGQIMETSSQAHTCFSGAHYFQMQSPFVNASTQSHIQLQRDILFEHMAREIHKTMQDARLQHLLEKFQREIVTQQQVGSNDNKKVLDFSEMDSGDDVSISTAPTEIDDDANAKGDRESGWTLVRTNALKKTLSLDSTRATPTSPQRQSTRIAEDINRKKDTKQCYYFYTDGSASTSINKVGRERNLQNFQKVTTRKDATAGWSVIGVRQVMNNNDPLASFTDGQNVPEEQFKSFLNFRGDPVCKYYGPVFTKARPKDSKHTTPDLYFGATQHTNQTAEISALYYGLLAAIEVARSAKTTYHYRFMVDSEFTIKAAIGVNKIKQSNITGMVIKMQKALCLLRTIVGIKQVQLLHIRSHTAARLYYNEEADKFAKQAAERRHTNIHSKNFITVDEQLDSTVIVTNLLGGTALLQQGVDRKDSFLQKQDIPLSQWSVTGANTDSTPTLPRSASRTVVLGPTVENHKERATNKKTPIAGKEKRSIQEAQKCLKRHKKKLTLTRANGQFFEYLPGTKLCDIPDEDLNGILMFAKRTDQYLLQRYRNDYAEVFSNIVEDVITGLEDPETVSDEQRLMEPLRRLHILPSLVFRGFNGKEDQQSLEAKIHLLGDAEGWKQLTVGDLTLRSMPNVRKNDDQKDSTCTNDQLNNKVIKLVEERVKHSEPGNGYQVLVQPNSLAPRTDQNIEALKKYFPQLHQPISQKQIFTEEEYKDKFNMQSQDEGVPAPRNSKHVVYKYTPIDSDAILQYLSRAPKTKSPGIDGSRPGHWLSLISGASRNPVRQRCLKNLTWLANAFQQGKLPVSYGRLLAEAECVPALKTAGKIRPIQMVQTFRKMVSTIHAANIDTTSFFGDLQLGIKRRFGTEHIVHAMQMQIHGNPRTDKVFIDFENAFNNISREQVLEVIAEHFPYLYPTFQAMYHQSQNTWVMAENGVVKAIAAHEGMQQGDPLGSFGFAAGSHHLFRQCEEKIDERAAILQKAIYSFCAAYVDDFSAVAMFEKAMLMLQHIIAEGPKIGLIVNLQKSVILMGARDNDDTANEQRNAFIGMGLKSENVILHSDNAASLVDATTTRRGKKLTAQQLSEVSSKQKLIYGYQCLGVPVGTTEYISHWLSQKLQELNEEKDKFMGFTGSRQSMLLMFRYCFCSKVTYLTRTLPLHQLNSPLTGNGLSFLEAFDQMKIEVLEYLLQLPKDFLTPNQKTQALLQIRDGGLGLSNSLQTAHAAFVASIRSSWEYLNSINPSLNTEIDMEWLELKYNNSQDLSEEQITKEWLERMTEHSYDKSTIVQNFITSIQQIINFDPKFSVTDLFIKELKDQEFIRLQNRIQQPLRRHHQQQFLTSISDVDKLRLNSCIGNRDDASAWLESMPRDANLSIPDKPFIYALRIRLGIRFPDLISDEAGQPMQCLHCKNKWIDEEAHHLIGGCPYGGHRQATHESVANTIIKVLSKATRKTKKGTPVIFDQSANPNAKNKDVIIPDIEVYHKGRKDLLDVTICDRILPFVNPNRTTTPTDSATAESREKQKLAKYRDHGLTSNNNGKIIPIAIETFGKMGKLGFDYLSSIAQEFGKGYKATTIKRYWFRLISIALQRQIGEGIAIQLDELAKGKLKTKVDEEEEEIEEEIISSMVNRITCVPTRKGLKGLKE